MLSRLSLKNFVIVKSLDLDITSGFTVLTGETGAGKSILLDALGLILGDRADAGVVAQGADKADINAEFISSPTIDAWLHEAELTSDDDQIMVRRVIDAQGKSRAYINGIGASVAQLKELGEQLVHIHGQHAHQQLLKSSAQRDLIDRHAQLTAQRTQVQTAHQQWLSSKTLLDTALNDAAQLSEKLDAISWQLEGVNQLAPQQDEWETLSAEHARLAHAAALVQGTASAAHALKEDDQSVIDVLAEQISAITALIPHDARLNDALELLDAAMINVQEASHFLSAYAQRSDLSESMFAQLDQRMSDWMAQARKLRVAPEDLNARWLELQSEQNALQAGLDINQLKTTEQALFATFTSHAATLTAARTQAAATLSQQVTASMQLLNMTGGQFVIALSPAAPSASGVDAIEFLVAGHAGVKPQALSKVASGGELARISLALSVITSTANPVPTLIFDEVDSGIGGAVAQVVGGLLAQLGHTRQVLCVTHLPQVAAQGQHHWQVSKKTVAQQTHSTIHILDTDQRIDEIARMLGGVDITDTTRAHAREMLA